MKPKEVVALMLEKKATNIKIFNVIKITTMTDYFIMCTSNSEPQTRAILNHINRSLKKIGEKSEFFSLNDQILEKMIEERGRLKYEGIYLTPSKIHTYERRNKQSKFWVKQMAIMRYENNQILTFPRFPT